MGDSTAAATLLLDYELMENYVIASPLAAYTEVAAVTDQNGLPEALVLGGVNTSIVSHVFQDPTSDTGWGYDSLAPVPDGNVIKAIAAITGTDNRRTIAVATPGPNVYVTQENTPGNRDWVPWVNVSTLPTVRIVLRICNGTLVLALVTQYASYGDLTDFQIVSGVLNWQAIPPIPPWQGSASFHSDLSVCDFVYDTTNDPNEMKVTGCLSPTLSLFEVSAPHFSPAIWTTSGNDSYNPWVSVYRPLPGDPNAVLIADAIALGEEQSTAPTGLTVLCAGSVEDPTSGTPMLTLATDLNHIWDTHGVGTETKATLWQPAPIPPNYTKCTVPQGKNTIASATCWFMGVGKNKKPPFQNGKIQLGTTWIGVGLIRDDLLTDTLLNANPAFTSTAEGRHDMVIFGYQSSQGFPISNSYVFAGDGSGSNPFPSSAPYPAAALTRFPGLLLQAPVGQSSPISAVSRNNASSFSNWCQIAKSDGSARSFAVDDSGAWWYVESLEPGGAWQSLSGISAGFSPCSSQTGVTLAGMQVSDGSMQLFAVGADAVLYTISETASNGNTFNDAVPIGLNTSDGIASFALVPAAPNTSAPRLFAVSNEATPALYYISMAGDEYRVTEVQLQNSIRPLPLEQISAYTVDARLKDSSGVLMQNTGVTIVSTQPCTAIVNGVAARLLPGVSNAFDTNKDGGLHLIIPTANISAPTLTFTVAGQTFPDVPLNSKVLQNLSQMTAAEFAAATDAKGNQLFADSTTSTSLQAAISKLCAYANGGDSTTQSAPAAQVSGGRVADSAWKISFDSSRRADFRVLTGNENAAAPGAALLGASLGGILHAKWNDVKGWFNSNAGKIEALAHQLQDDGDVLLTFTLTIAQTTNQYAYTLQKADPNLKNAVLDIASGLMRNAGATIAQITQWLSLLFDWEHIGLTKQALDYAFTTCFDLLKQQASSLQTNFDAQFTSGVFNTAGKDLAAAIQSIQTKTLSSISQFPLANLPATVTVPRVQASFLIGHLKMFGGSSLVQVGDTTKGFTTDLQTLKVNMTTVMGDVLANGTVQARMTAMKATTPPISSDQLAQQTVSSLFAAVENMANALVSLVQQAVDDLLGLGQAGVQALEDLLTGTSVYIPWVSELYQLRFGEPLTILGVVSSSIAIPATTLFQQLAGHVPFAAQSDVDDFKAGFTTANLLGIWGLAGAEWQQQVSANSLARLQDAATLLSLGGYATRVYVDQLLDSVAATGASVPSPGSFALSAADLSSSLALFASSACGLVADMVEDPTSAPNIIAATALTVDGAHWAINAVFTCAPGVAQTLMLEGNAGICLDMALSGASTALSTLADGLDYGLNFDANNPPVALAGDVLSALSTIGHIGVMPEVAEESDSGSVLPALLLDYLADEYGLWTTVQDIATV